MENEVMTAAALVIIVASIYFLADNFLGTQHDSKEPPLIPQPFPYIGHLFGLLRNGPKYYSRLSAKYPFPIYTLGMPGGTRTYVVNSPALVAAVQRNPKTLSFAPYVVNFAARILRPSERALEILGEGIDEKGANLQLDTKKGMQASLAPGHELLKLSKCMLEELSRCLEVFDSDTQPVKIDMYAWFRDAMTLVSTNAVYGPNNAFKEKKFLNDFWTLERNFTSVFLDMCPMLTAYKGHQARESISAGFTKYFRDKGHERGSALVRARFNANSKHGVSLADTGRFEVASSIGLLVNTSPAVFWMLYYVYSDSNLTRDLREELFAVVRDDSPRPVEGSAANLRHLDISKVMARCPLLVSTFQEVLRVQSTNAAVRVVTEDTVIGHHYLLKENGLVQIPTRVLHSNPDHWGPSVSDFNPRRFMEHAGKEARSKITPGAFQSFGGGTTLCPGRHFATTMVLSVLIIFLTKYEIKPVSEAWTLPTQSAVHLSTSILPPDHDIKVVISRRTAGPEGSSWTFYIGSDLISDS